MSEKVTIQIMGEEFTIKCSPEEKTFLIKAATLVDETMTKIKSQGTAFSINRIADWLELIHKLKILSTLKLN